MFKLTARTSILLLRPFLPRAGAQRAHLRRRSRWRLAAPDEAVPGATPYNGSTPLVDLPLLSLDTEATGLDPRSDRVVSIAGARLQHGKLYLAQALDTLVDPRRPIPPQVTRIHGISDELVRHAPTFDLLSAELGRQVSGCVLLGHNVYFDAALLRHEMHRIGHAWQRPPLLDTMLLYASLHPASPDLSLDAVARRLRVSLTGRHTALGDVLIALDIYHRLLPRLAGRGILTLGQAEATSAEALKRLRKMNDRR